MPAILPEEHMEGTRALLLLFAHAACAAGPCDAACGMPVVGNEELGSHVITRCHSVNVRRPSPHRMRCCSMRTAVLLRSPDNQGPHPAFLREGSAASWKAHKAHAACTLKLARQDQPKRRALSFPRTVAALASARKFGCRQHKPAMCRALSGDSNLFHDNNPLPCVPAHKPGCDATG